MPSEKKEVSFILHNKKIFYSVNLQHNKDTRLENIDKKKFDSINIVTSNKVGPLITPDMKHNKLSIAIFSIDSFTTDRIKNFNEY